MLFYLAEIDLFSFLDLNVLVCIVIEEQHLKHRGLASFPFCGIVQKLVLPYSV